MQMNGSPYWILGAWFQLEDTFFFFQNCGSSCFAALCSADYCKVRCSHFPLFVHISTLVSIILLFWGKYGLSSFELDHFAHGTSGVENHPETPGGGHPELQLQQHLQWRPERLCSEAGTELLAESSWQRLLTLVPLL